MITENVINICVCFPCAAFKNSTVELLHYWFCGLYWPVWHAPISYTFYFPADSLLFLHKAVCILQKSLPIHVIHLTPEPRNEKILYSYYQVNQLSLFPYSLLISMQKLWHKLKPQIQLKVSEARLAITMGLWECFAPRLQPHSIIMLCIMFLSKREYKEWIAEAFMLSSASCFRTPSSPPWITHSVALFDIKAQWKK